MLQRKRDKALYCDHHMDGGDPVSHGAGRPRAGVIPPNNRAPHVMRGDAANIRTLSARYIADLQDHWEIHGQAALDEYREKFVDRYVENFSLLARVIRVEADVKRSMATPKTVDEALAELESKVGAKGRRKFEKFLREVAEDEDEDVIDVESK